MNLLDKLDKHIYWIIIDFCKGNPKDNYKKVMRHLEYNARMLCNKTCSYRLFEIDNELSQMPMLIKRKRGVLCHVCNEYPLSEYSHRYCNNCAVKGSYEYNYHHRTCRGFDSDQHPITNPL